MVAEIPTWKEKHNCVSEPAPLFVLYWTAWVDEGAMLHFRHDVYGYDDRLRAH